jgi:hypothetical protein
MSRRGRVGARVLLVYACGCAAWQCGRVVVTDAPAERHPALVAEYDAKRYAGLVDSLPPGGVVGYVLDEPDSAEAIRSYYLAQYVLAPCVLVRGEEQQLVLVDDPPNHEDRPSMAGRRLLRDLGNGVRLFGRGEP